MDSPVSAFAVYKQNKNSNHNKQQQRKKRKQKEVPTPLPAKKENRNISEDVIKAAAKSLKQKRKPEKETKDIGKKKLLKKKKTKVDKGSDKGKKQSKKKIAEVRQKVDIRVFEVNSESIPILVPATDPAIEHVQYDDDNASNSSFDFTPVVSNSVDEGIRIFNWMIAPFNPKDFYNKIWEKKPLFVSRNRPLYYKDLISTPIIDNMLRTQNIQYTKNIDITSYVDEMRETHNPVGRALPHVIWDYYLNGCSIRLLNPQTFIPKVHLLLATLQEFFNSFVGANVYLTPPDTQGFAPHYDDIEAFILQVEGKKKWRVYKPLTEKDVLPRVSSRNFKQNEIGTPLIEVVLEAGDMLYFPRGFIHQAVAIDGEHSLHITVSAYQKHCFADLFEKMVQPAIELAIKNNVEFRTGLPFDLYDNFGIVNFEVDNDRKQQTAETIKALWVKVKDYLPIDFGVDQLAKDFQFAALPPVLTDMEKAVTVYGDSDVMTKDGRIIHRVEIGLDTRVRLLRRNILRMVSEKSGEGYEEVIRLYHSVENSLEYHGHEQQFLEIDHHLAPAVETLLIAYPEYVYVENLDVSSESDKLQIATDLWERGLIMTEYPLETIEDD